MMLIFNLYVFIVIISLIVPLAYYGDYRPYFTIHDNEFKEYMTKTLNPPHIILGVTNPYFSKTLQHWPHIVRVTDTSKKGNYIMFNCHHLCIGLKQYFSDKIFSLDF